MNASDMLKTTTSLVETCTTLVKDVEEVPTSPTNLAYKPVDGPGHTVIEVTTLDGIVLPAILTDDDIKIVASGRALENFNDDGPFKLEITEVGDISYVDLPWFIQLIRIRNVGDNDTESSKQKIHIVTDERVARQYIIYDGNIYTHSESNILYISPSATDAPYIHAYYRRDLDKPKETTNEERNNEDSTSIDRSGSTFGDLPPNKEIRQRNEEWDQWNKSVEQLADVVDPLKHLNKAYADLILGPYDEVTITVKTRQGKTHTITYQDK